MRTLLVGSVYTLAELLEMPLPDSPNLIFGVTTGDVVQTAHLTDKRFLSLPGWAETEWRYIKTTSEQIPIFHAIDKKSIFGLVEMRGYYWDGENRPLFYPKGS